MSILTKALFGVVVALVAYFAYVKVPSLSNSNVLKHKEVQQWIQTGRYFNFNGYSIFYRDSIGDALAAGSSYEKLSELANQPILLLVHGFPTFSYDWASLYPDLEKQSLHVVALDMLGFGLSDKPHDLAYGFGLEADVVEGLLGAIHQERHLLGSKIGSQSIHILAHDLGDSVVQEMLARQSERQTGKKPHPYVPFPGHAVSPRPAVPFTIGNVVLLNGGMFPEVHQKTKSQAAIQSKYTGPLIQILSTYKTFAPGLAHVFGEHTKPAESELRIFWDAVCYKDGQYLLHNLQQYITERRNNRERLVHGLVEAASSLPVLFINGPADPVSGRHMAKRYLEVVPREVAHVVLLGDSVGHYPQLEAREEVLRLVIESVNKNRK